jgi:hypothetical protein
MHLALLDVPHDLDPLPKAVCRSQTRSADRRSARVMLVIGENEAMCAGELTSIITVEDRGLRL